MPLIQLPNIQMMVEREGQGHPLLLIMGIGGQLIQWPPDFRQALIEQGFELILADNRDVGLSEKLDHLGVPDVQRGFWRQAFKRPIDAPYTLEDMAEDYVQLLDALELPKCHVLGISMGSMIAQILAAKNPQRIQTVTLMHTNTGKLRHGLQTKPKALQALTRRTQIRNAEEFADYFVELFTTVGSPTLLRPQANLREAGRALYNRGYFPNGFQRQMMAIFATGDRERFYSRIQQPTAVIQGHKDPLLSLSAGRAVVHSIPNARGHYFEDLGHDIPEKYVHTFAKIIRDLARIAD